MSSTNEKLHAFIDPISKQLEFVSPLFDKNELVKNYKRISDIEAIIQTSNDSSKSSISMSPEPHIPSSVSNPPTDGITRKQRPLNQSSATSNSKTSKSQPQGKR